MQPNYSEAEHPAQEKTVRRQKAKNDHIKIRKYKNTHQKPSNHFYSTDSTTHICLDSCCLLLLFRLQERHQQASGRWQQDGQVSEKISTGSYVAELMSMSCVWRESKISPFFLLTSSWRTWGPIASIKKETVITYVLLDINRTHSHCPLQCLRMTSRHISQA